MATRALTIDLVTAEVVTALRAAGVRHILLKGPSVALWLYPGGAGRGYVDTDVLVPPGDWPRAEQVLRAIGFVNLLAGTTEDEQDASAFPWHRARDGMSVDLHRNLRGVGVADQAAWDELAANTVVMAVAGRPVDVLAPAARALNLGLHAAHDGIANRQCLLDLTRAIADLPAPVWDEAARLAARLRAIAAFASGLRLQPAGVQLATRLGLPATGSVETRLRATTPPPLALGFATLAQLPGMRAKFRYLRHNLVPTRAYMRFWSPLARRGTLGMGLAYAWRWIALARFAIPGYRAFRRIDRGTR